MTHIFIIPHVQTQSNRVCNSLVILLWLMLSRDHFVSRFFTQTSNHLTFFCISHLTHSTHGIFLTMCTFHDTCVFTHTTKKVQLVMIYRNLLHFYNLKLNCDDMCASEKSCVICRSYIPWMASSVFSDPFS
jgi:hypothetical protein